MGRHHLASKIGVVEPGEGCGAGLLEDRIHLEGGGAVGGDDHLGQPGIDQAGQQGERVARGVRASAI